MQKALLSACGILAALTIERTFLPAVRTPLEPPDEAGLRKEGRATVFDPFLRGVAAWINGGKSGFIFALLGLLLALSAIGLARLKTENSPSAFFARDTPVITDLEATNAKGAGVFLFQVLVEGPDEDALEDPRLFARWRPCRRTSAPFPVWAGHLARRLRQEDEPGNER